MKYLIDTNICIYLIRQKSPALLEKFTRFPIGDIGVSSITVAELQYGVHRSAQHARNQQALEQFLIPLAILDFDYDAAQAYGRLSAHLEAHGTPIGSLDTLIAAHALAHQLTLVTNNVQEFARVPELTIEDWSSP